MLPSFYLKGEKGEVQAQLVSMKHSKSPLAQVDMVVVGEVIATDSVTIKIHMPFYKHLELVKSLHIEPKGENIVLVSNAFKKYNEYAFSSTSTRKKKNTGSSKMSIPSKVGNIDIQETFLLPHREKKEK